MNELELYARVIAIREEIDKALDAVMDLPPTIELLYFCGKLSAAADVLIVLEEGGPPVEVVEASDERTPLS